MLELDGALTRPCKIDFLVVRPHGHVPTISLKKSISGGGARPIEITFFVVSAAPPGGRGLPAGFFVVRPPPARGGSYAHPN